MSKGAPISNDFLKEIICRNSDEPIQRLIKIDERYFCQYPVLMKLGNCARVNDDDTALFALELAVYAWMPQTMSSRPSSILTPKEINAVRTSDSPLFELVENIGLRAREREDGHSWVGLSKVLHFLRPNCFAVWDSHVARSFGLKHSYQINSGNAYLDYVRSITDLQKHVAPQVAEIQSHVRRLAGYEIGPLRALELSLFVNGKDLRPKRA